MKTIGIAIGSLRMNCYIYYDEETKKGVIIDPGFDDAAIHEAVRENGVEIVGILLTHGHFDHIGGAESCKNKYDALIYAHESEIPIMKNSQLNGSARFMRKTLEARADVKLAEGDEISVGAGKLRVIHTPGHTIGGVCYYDEENGTLFSGDTLFFESVGRSDFATGSMPELLDSILQKLFVLPDGAKVYTGHMRPTTIGHEKRYNPFIDET